MTQLKTEEANTYAPETKVKKGSYSCPIDLKVDLTRYSMHDVPKV